LIILLVAALAVLVLTLSLAARAPRDEPGLLVRALDTRAVAGAVFALTLITLHGTWGPAIPVVQDEMAYVLQAEIFAQGKWALPAQPIPAFWEQPQVIVQPVVASKYFPGHSLLLALGVLVGFPTSIPLLLGALTGALLFVLARRVANGAVAVLAWVVWLGSPIVLYYGPSYFSEVTTTACWLAGWYALLQWRASRRLGWLLAVAFIVGWTVLTRPLTGVAYAIPVAIVVLRDVFVLKRWRDLGAGMAAGCAVLAIIPLWSARTTGHPALTPLALYTAQYRPYDVPGFGLIATKPALAISPQLERLNARDYGWHAAHVPSALPNALWQRWNHLTSVMWGTLRWPLMIFALFGLVTLRGPSLFAVASAILLLVVYLSFAAPAPWVLYYYESVPALSCLVAAGIASAIALLGRARRGAPSLSPSWRSTRWTAPLIATAAILLIPAVATYRIVSGWHRQEQGRMEQFALMRERITTGRAVVFVRYLPEHDPNFTFVRNFSNPAAERVWVVRDLGDEQNARLLEQVPDRAAFIFDETRNQVHRLLLRAPPGRLVR
jgi:hypothetical protein